MPERLRIGLLTHSVNPRGGVVHTLELARALHGAGHAVTVFAPAQPGQRFFREVAHRVSLAPVGPAPTDLAALVGERIEAFRRHLAPLLARERFDVLHAHDGIGANALADLAQAGAITGFVRTVHHLDPFGHPQLDAWQRRGVSAATRLLCVSATWARALRAEFGREAALVGNGVDLVRYTRQRGAVDTALAARLGLRPGVPRWLLVGGVEARKNTLRVLQAFLGLRAAHAGAQLIVAGGASLLDHGPYAREFEAAVAASGVSVGTGCDLVLTGTLADAEMPALFRSAGALLMPSLREGFGLVVLEALACGTPAVVSDRPPFTEYLGEAFGAGHAIATDPLDVAAIAAAMARAIDPARRAALAQAVPPVCLRHGWAASAQRHLALYRALALAPAP